MKKTHNDNTCTSISHSIHEHPTTPHPTTPHHHTALRPTALSSVSPPSHQSPRPPLKVLYKFPPRPSSRNSTSTLLSSPSPRPVKCPASWPPRRWGEKNVMKKYIKMRLLRKWIEKTVTWKVVVSPSMSRFHSTVTWVCSQVKVTVKLCICIDFHFSFFAYSIFIFLSF